MRRLSSRRTVGINAFVLRQCDPAFAGTKITQQQLEQLRAEAEQKLNAGQTKPGYAPFCLLVETKHPEIAYPIAEVTPANEKFLITEMTRRREGEEEYEHSYFANKDVAGIPSDHVNAILYTRGQLEAESGDPTGADFDIISVNAEAKEETPIPPTTMRRNIAGPSAGGSGFQHSEEEIKKSEQFWEKHALIK